MRTRAVTIALTSAVSIALLAAAGSSSAEGQPEPVVRTASLDSSTTTPTPQAAGQAVAQATCFSNIASCKTISTDKLCHATQKVVYIRVGGQWCKTPTTCAC